jgi:perosamine synthetase
MSHESRIPVSSPDIREPEISAVLDALRSGWISSAGPQLDAFESSWAAYCGRRHGIAVSSGTTALELLVEAIGIGEGDEVIMPTFTIISCALAVVRAGGIPVLVDADPITWCMDTHAVEARITERTRAMMAVHIYGHPCDMTHLGELATRHGIQLIEDAAEAHGAECRVDGAWRRCGSFGVASAFSFYANKLVTTGEGGMIVTDDDDLAAQLRLSRNLGFRSERRFLHTELAHQYRLTNLQAALALPQIARMTDTIGRKRAIAEAYAARLGDIEFVELQFEQPWARSVYWMFGLVLSDHHPLDGESFARRLEASGIETRPFFLGMHEQPALKALGLFAGEEHPVAERIARRGLYLPSGPTLSHAQIDRVCTAVSDALQ